MRSLKLNTAVTVTMLFITVMVYGQGSGRITGIVKDAVTHENVSFATVTLADQQTKAAVKGLQTDLNGNFVLDNVPAGVFTLRIGYVGYEDIIKENIVIKPDNLSLDLGILLMNTSKNNSLKEVVVAGKKADLQNIDGKKVFSVNQSLVSKGGNAADLLQNVPTLQIDVNGNVSLRGSIGVKVLIDGKPSVIANGDITQILQSIPASTIENIEVITNPSAKYDAEGEGIINIVLKKNSRQGLNGSVELSGGTRDNYSGSTSLSYQRGKVNLFGNYSIKDGNTYSNGIQNMTILKPVDSIRYSNEVFPSVTRNKIQFLKAGIDYSLTPKSVLSISGSLNLRNTHRDEVLTVDNLDSNGAPVQLSNRYNTTNNNGNGYEVNIDYAQHFKKPREELTFNFSYAYGSFKNWQQYETQLHNVKGQQVSIADTPLISDVRNNAKNYNIQADYVLPVGKTGEFDAGYRTQITIGNNNQYAYNAINTGNAVIYNLTSFFSSNNLVNAFYLNYQGGIGNFSYQVGLRAEDSHLNATFTSYNVNNTLFASPVKVPVTGLYPSVLLTQKLEKNSQLQFSFSKRVSRPTARELNSTTDFSDPVNYERGNPGLMPESITSLQLGFNKTWQNVSFTSALYYNGINNVIKHIQSDPVDGVVTYTLPENLKHSTTTGMELIGHVDVVKGWDFTANANIYDRENDAAPQFGITANTGLSWNANVTTNVSIMKSLALQIHADYRAQDFVVQDQNRPAFGLDAAAKYDFPRNRASLGFNATDIFNSRKWAFLRSSDDIILDFQRERLSSRATLTFTYRFGSGTPKPQQRKKEVKQDKRIDDAS